MLKGLEITVINKNSIPIDNIEFRLDSEYYKKEYLSLYKKIENSPMLDSLVSMSDLSTNGSFAHVASIIHDNHPKIVPFIRSGNVGTTFINKEELDFISKEAHDRLPKSTTYLHDIIMARKGKIGGASIIMPEDINLNSNENVIKLNILEKNITNPFYFTAYFNSKYGLKQVERLSTGNVQPWVSIFQIKKLKLFIPSIRFQESIQQIILIAHEKIQKSKALYKEGERRLLDVVGLNNFIISEQSVNIKSFKNSFLSTARLDAEYYQPKYEEIEKQIILNNKYDTLNNILLKIETGEYSPVYYNKNEKEGLTFYIRSTNIKNGQIVFDDDYYVEKRLFNRIARKGEIVTARVGTVGVFGEIRNEVHGSVYSDNVLCFQLPSDFIPSVYTMLFNTKYYFEFIDRLARGSVQQRLNQETLKDLIIPIIDLDIQNSISELIENSIKLKSESELLLKIAHKAIDLVIEEDEETVFRYLESNVH